MIHGESYKPIIAEAARKSASEVYNRIMVTHLLMDKAHPNRVAGAVGFNVRDGELLRLPGQGGHRRRRRRLAHLPAALGRRRHGQDLVCALEQRLGLRPGPAHRRQDDPDGEPDRPRPLQGRLRPGRRLVPAAQGQATNAYGENYEASRLDEIKALVGKYAEITPMPTCLRNHAMLQEVKAGNGPIYMQTQQVLDTKEKEEIGWEDFLDMTVGQAVVWASQNIDPKEKPSELTTSEPYVMGSHATCSGAWASGPEDCAPADYQWGYNRMTTVEGLFGAGDTIGGSAHKFSSGSFTEGRIAGKSAVKYVMELAGSPPQVDEAQVRMLQEEIFKPLENYRNRQERDRRRQRGAELHLAASRPAAAGENHGRVRRRHQHLLRDQRTDAQPRPGTADHAEGGSRPYRRRGPPPAPAGMGAPPPGLDRGGGAQAHAVTGRRPDGPGYYYRGDYPKLDDADWHAFTASQYDVKTGEWTMSKLPVHHIIE